MTDDATPKPRIWVKPSFKHKSGIAEHYLEWEEWPWTWLKGSPDEAFKLVQRFAPERMRIVQLGQDREDLLAA